MIWDGVRAYYPAQAYDVEAGASDLTIYAPTNRINHSGATLGGPVLTVRVWSPLPDVIGVRIRH